MRLSYPYYITDSGLNLISLDWIDALNLFSMPLNTVFNIFVLSSVYEIENYFVHSLKTKLNDVFTENLGYCTKVKTVLKLMPVLGSKRPVPYATLDFVVQSTNYSA